MEVVMTHRTPNLLAVAAVFNSIVLLAASLAALSQDIGPGGSVETSGPSASYDPPPESTVLELSFINVVFSDAVKGIKASDLLINGVGATSVVTNNPNDYTFYFAQPLPGT